jgi:hypothetical protein
MIVKNLTVLVGSLLSLSLWTTAAIPGFAQSNETSNQNSYQIGTVVGKTGDILSVKLEDGTRFSGTAPDSLKSHRIGRTGINVLVDEQDGKYTIVDVAQPEWLGQLNRQ